MEAHVITGIVLGVIFSLILLKKGIKIIRPTDVAAVETFGKYKGFKKSGIIFILPYVQKLYKVNVTEQLVNVQKQDVITKENLNCWIDAQIYFRVGSSEEDLKKALYNVNNYNVQIVQLAKTTLRDVIGTKMFKDVNSNRRELNSAIQERIANEMESWGIKIIRTELKEIIPPADVQETMNRIIKAENQRDSNKDFATAAEIEADGIKRAAVKKAEGQKQSAILEAEGKALAIIKVAEADAAQIEIVAKADAQRIKVVNESAKKYFTGPAQSLKKMEMTESSLKDNSKVIMVQDGINPSIILSDEKVIPVDNNSNRTKEEKEDDDKNSIENDGRLE